jgi:hypothetical protein
MMVYRKYSFPHKRISFSFDSNSELKGLNYHDGKLELLSRYANIVEIGIQPTSTNSPLLIRIKDVVLFSVVDYVAGTIVNDVNLENLSELNWKRVKNQIILSGICTEEELNKHQESLTKNAHSFFYIGCSYGADVKAVIQGGSEKIECYTDE